MKNRFQENLRLFGKKNPKAEVLFSFAEAGSLDVVQDAAGDEILVDRTTNIDFFYHAPKGARKEAEEWVQTLELDGVEILAVFGLGLGWGYFTLASWLKQDPKRSLVFLEDDLRVILRFLESDNASHILHNPQVQIFYIEDSEQGLGVLQSLAWAAYGKNMAISALPFYERMRNKVFEDVKARLLYETSDIHLVLDEYVGYGISFFRNFWKNLFLWPGSYRGNKLQGAFRNIPAIVVGAGPSLAQHLDSLRVLRDKALLFAGGSSINALTDAGIVPHFGAGIDPNAMQYLRFRQALNFQVPIFYRSRILHSALELVQAPRLYLKGGDGYNISDWFEQKLKIPGRLIGGGHSVANFIIEIALSLGCNPIILVGFDLAFGKDLALYAPGVEGGHHVTTTQKSSQDEPIVWKGEDGKEVHTAWKWLLEAKWIEEFAASHPRSRIINATEGGLGVKNIPHMSLAAASEKYLTISRDLDSLVHTALQEAKTIAADPRMLFHGCSQMYDSLERAKHILEKLAEIAQKSKSLKTLEDPHTILLESDLKKEIAYRYILEVFDRMRAKLEYYRLEFASHPTIMPKQLQAREMELLHERFVFLKDTATVNQLLIAQSIQLQIAQGKDVTAFSPKSQVLWT